MEFKKVKNRMFGKVLMDSYGILYSIDKKELLMCDNHRLRDYVVPEGTEKIRGFAFKDKFNITSLKFPSSLVAIGGWAFENCINLTSLEIPSGVTRIEERVFKNCTDLATIKMSTHITSIGMMAFELCENLHSIEFAEDSCNEEGEGIFNLYERESSPFFGEVKLPEGLVSIGHAAFCGCRSIRMIELPSTLREIDGNPFCECHAQIINHSPHIKDNIWREYSRWEKI